MRKWSPGEGQREAQGEADAESVEIVLYEHAEEVAFLWSQRALLVSSPDVTLPRLVAFDERLAAHVDGLRVAGAAGWRLCERSLASEEPGEMFAATILAAEDPDAGRLRRLLALGETVPAMRPGLVAALGWISPARRRDLLRALFASSSLHHRLLAIACCAANLIDPGDTLVQVIEATAETTDAPLVATAQCGALLRDGFQRQRAAAAVHLSLLEPGRSLFPTDAPTADQRRWLGVLDDRDQGMETMSANGVADRRWVRRRTVGQLASVPGL